ncbi:MAG TPA: hypothetical protein VI277_07520 [Candidatus Limnocylindria bacterium]
MRRILRPAGCLVAIAALSGCVLAPGPSPTSPPAASAPPSSEPSSASSTQPSITAAPTATPAPSFSLTLPGTTDSRIIEVAIAPDVDAEGGEIVVSVTNTSDERIDEIVLRWATDLDEVLFLSPFEPSEERIREGGPPLVQEWTKWVVGPGERGEPAGTTSLGYGPLLAGATLEIPILAERRQTDPIAFDLQLLSDNDLLQIADGEPAAFRVELP